MLPRWRLGSVLGFPIDIKASFLLLLAVVFFAFGGLAGVIGVGIAFASVVLHELGHAVVARKLRVKVENIELGFFGGAARMVSAPQSANDEIAIAAAGPAVSVVLAAASFGLAALMHSPSISPLVGLLGWINTVIALFNLLPALPMDGGRILRAALTRKFSFVRATEISVTIARGFAIAFALYGIVGPGSFQLALLAFFLWGLGSRELVIARMTADQYGYTKRGYFVRNPSEAHVYSTGPTARAAGGAAWEPFFARRDTTTSNPGAGPTSGKKFKIRRVNGQFVVEITDPLA